jgi:hypothetical protein
MNFLPQSLTSPVSLSAPPTITAANVLENGAGAIPSQYQPPQLPDIPQIPQEVQDLQSYVRSPLAKVGLNENLLSQIPDDASNAAAALARKQFLGDDHFTTPPLELDSEVVAVGRRLYAQFDLVVLFANCVSACISIPAAISLIPTDSVFALQCDYGQSLGAYQQCPYTTSPIFMGFMGFCIVYFLSFITYKIYNTFDYFTNDLRFYIASDMVVNDFVHQVFVYVGFGFTVTGGLAALGFVIKNGTTDSIGSILTFMFVNFFTFRQLMRGNYVSLYKQDMRTLFPRPIYFKLPRVKSPFRLIVMNHGTIFSYMLEAMICSYAANNDSLLVEMGEPQALRAAIQTLCNSALKY